MYNEIIQSSRNALNTAWGALQSASIGVGKGIYKGYDFLGKKVEKLSADYLNEAVAGVVSKTFWSLPYTVAVVALTYFLGNFATGFVLGAVIAGWPGFAHRLDEAVGREHREHMYRGIRNASCINAVCFAADVVAEPGFKTVFLLIGMIQVARGANKISKSELPKIPEPVADAVIAQKN
jgi:hypothetical protein